MSAFATNCSRLSLEVCWLLKTVTRKNMNWHSLPSRRLPKFSLPGIITARKQSCRKVMFSLVSFCHFVQGRGSPRGHYLWCIGTWIPPIPDMGPILTPWIPDIGPTLPTSTDISWWPPKYGWQVGSTHPTEMLSSLVIWVLQCHFFTSWYRNS